MLFHDLDLPGRLATARRGTAYFAQRLADLTDADLDAPSLLPGWTRRHVVAHVGYNAAALCNLMDWAATGVETPMYPSPEHRAREIDEGATLSPAALRNLFDPTVARLDEKWRTATGTAWEARVRTAQGREVPASETAWMRSREVWIHAVDLGNGGRFADFPEPVLRSLVAEVAALWRARGDGAGLVLEADGAEYPVTPAPADGPTRRVSGSLAAVTRWACGRGAVGLSPDPGPAPRWL